jgi:hypothetical protein
MRFEHVRLKSLAAFTLGSKPSNVNTKRGAQANSQFYRSSPVRAQTAVQTPDASNSLSIQRRNAPAKPAKISPPTYAMCIGLC